MKYLILFCAVVAFAAGSPAKVAKLSHGLPPPPPANKLAREAVWKAMRQPQDHFDSSNKKVWTMRYIENDQFFMDGGPIFIMLGAEWEADPARLEGGMIFDLAYLHDGAMYYTEHRYYGASFPVRDLSTDNMRFLSSRQALADVANLIRSLKAKPEFANSKVVVIGGSYGGNLAIWMREQYPDLVHAAWSSSAPVLAKIDFFEYNEVVSNTLTGCTGLIARAIEEIQHLLHISDGVTLVSADFNVCHKLNTTNFGDISYFYFSIFTKFAGAVQYATTAKINALCNELLDPKFETDYEALVEHVTGGGSGCVMDYEDFLRFYRDTALSNWDSRSWMYQTCTEFGYFQTSTSTKQPFVNLPVELYHTWCKDIFGDRFTEQLLIDGVAATNQRYGGRNPDVTRVVSTHGTYDPWHPLGLSQDLNPEAPVIIIQDVSHVPDFNSMSTADNPSLKAAKTRIFDLFDKWLSA